MRLARLGAVVVSLLVGCTTPARLVVDERAWIQLETENFTIWTCVDELPYDEMWADDRIWLPMLLRAEPFHGRFLFEDDRMVDHEMLPYSPSENGGPPGDTQ